MSANPEMTNNFQVIHSFYEQFNVKCAQISQKDCQSLCNQSDGVLKTVETEVTCVHFKIAKAVCMQVDFSAPEPKLIGGCFSNNALEYYDTLKLGKKYSLKDLVG